MRKVSLIVAVLAAVMVLALPLSAQDKEIEEANKFAEDSAAEAKEAFKTDVEITKIQAFSYCAVEMTGSYEQHADAFMKLYTAAGQQGLPSRSASPFGIYYNSPEDADEKDLKWEIGFPIPKDMDVQAPLVKKEWKYTMVAQQEFTGVIDSDELRNVYVIMHEWIEMNGYELDGPMMERFLNNPTPNEKGETIGKVQIVFPVKKK